MGDSNSSNTSSNCKPLPGIRPMLRQAPLNIENMPSRVRGSNLKVLPPKFDPGCGGGFNGNSGQNRGGQGCFPSMPPPGCFMPPPMCSPYPPPMCTPCYPPCPPQQMCYPPPCPPPVFCCPQPQPYYCQYPSMPPPECCPPPPCPPPPCCTTNNKKESQCCGGAKTLVCMPKGQRPMPGQTAPRNSMMGRPGGGGMPSMDQPASYNNCNFYVQDLPKGLNIKSLMGRGTGTSEDRKDEECEAEEIDPSDPYGNHEMMNIPAGDGKVFPPPNERSWGNDNVPISGRTDADTSTRTGTGTGGRRGNTTNIYIGDNDDEEEERYVENIGRGRGRGIGRGRGGKVNAPHKYKPLGHPGLRRDMAGNHVTTGRTTTGNRTTAGDSFSTQTRTMTGNRTTTGNTYGVGNRNTAGTRTTAGDSYGTQNRMTGTGNRTNNTNNTYGGANRNTTARRISYGNEEDYYDELGDNYGRGGTIERGQMTGGNMRDNATGNRTAGNTPGGIFGATRGGNLAGQPFGVNTVRAEVRTAQTQAQSYGVDDARMVNVGHRGNVGTTTTAASHVNRPPTAARMNGNGRMNNIPKTQTPIQRHNGYGIGGPADVHIQGLQKAVHTHGTPNSPNTPVKEYKEDIKSRAASRGGPRDDDFDDGREDDGRGHNGQGVRNKGGWAGGPVKDKPSADYCIAQDFHKPCTPVTWKRKKGCCMPLKSRKLKTLCQKCHTRYAPPSTGVDEHCGLPMPSPKQIPKEASKAIIQKATTPQKQEVHTTQEFKKPNHMCRDINPKIDLERNNKYPHQNFVAHQVLTTELAQQQQEEVIIPFSAPRRQQVEKPLTPRSNSEHSSASCSWSESDSKDSCSSEEQSSENQEIDIPVVNSIARLKYWTHNNNNGSELLNKNSQKKVAFKTSGNANYLIDQASLVQLLHPRILNTSASHEIANPLSPKQKSDQRLNEPCKKIANILSVPELELFNNYESFLHQMVRSRSTNHVHELRKTAVRNSILFHTGNTEVIANYMTIAANADPRLNIHYQIPNQNCQIQNNTSYQVPIFQQQCPPTTEILPSHSEIQRIVITKDPNKHTQNVQVIKRHVPHHCVNKKETCEEPLQPVCKFGRQPQCPIPQCPEPQPICQPLCPVPKPPCPVIQAPCKPKCQLSIQRQCPMNIESQCPVPEPKMQITNIETAVNQNANDNVEISQSHSALPSPVSHWNPPPIPQQPQHHTLTITRGTEPDPTHTVSLVTTEIPESSYCNGYDIQSRIVPPSNLTHSIATGSTSLITSIMPNSFQPPPETIRTLCMPKSCPPPVCAKTCHTASSAISISHFQTGSEKLLENSWKAQDSVTSTIRSIYGDPVVRPPPSCYQDTVQIPNPNTSVTISSYEGPPNFGLQSSFPGPGMSRYPGYLHQSPTVPTIPITKDYPPPCRPLPRLCTSQSQTELKISQYNNYPTEDTVTQHPWPYQPQENQPPPVSIYRAQPQQQQHQHQNPVPLYRTTTQTRMEILERPHQPSQVRIIKTPVKELIGYNNPWDRSGGQNQGGGQNQIGGQSQRSGQSQRGGQSQKGGRDLNPGLSGNGGYYQDQKKEANPTAKNACGISPCGPSKLPCFPLRPCRSPRLITCKGQKPIFSAMPPACPIRETLASILSKKPPANCKWHDKNVPPFYDYCMPSIKFHDPIHQRIKYVDHCGGQSGNRPEEETKAPKPSTRGAPLPFSKPKGRNSGPGRGVKRRLHQ